MLIWSKRDTGKKQRHAREKQQKSRNETRHNPPNRQQQILSGNGDSSSPQKPPLTAVDTRGNTLQERRSWTNSRSRECSRLLLAMRTSQHQRPAMGTSGPATFLTSIGPGTILGRGVELSSRLVPSYQCFSFSHRLRLLVAAACLPTQDSAPRASAYTMPVLNTIHTEAWVSVWTIFEHFDFRHEKKKRFQGVLKSRSTLKSGYLSDGTAARGGTTLDRGEKKP